MEDLACPVCAAMNTPDEAGIVLARTELVEARHAEVDGDDPTDFAGRIEIRPRRHVARWSRMTPAEHAEVDRITVALSLALHRVAGAQAVRPDDVAHEANATGHMSRVLQPEYPVPVPGWLADPRWQDHSARQQAIVELVERLRADLSTAR